MSTIKTIMEIWKYKQTVASGYGSLFPVVEGAEFLIDYHKQANTPLFDKRILTMYGNRRFVSFFGTSYMGDWNDTFKAFILMNIDNFQKAYDALKIEYNPLENYNGETITETTKEGTETTTNHYDEVNTESDPVTTTTTGKVSPENNETFYNSDQSTSEVGAMSTTTHEREDSTTLAFEDRKDTVTETKHGNLGLTTSQSMLSDEVSLRLYTDFLVMVFTAFIYENTF